MFLPIGDDVEKRSLPIMATALIAVNILVWVHTGTLWRESHDAAILQHAGEGQVIGTDLMGNPIFVTREMQIKKGMSAKKWENFLHEWGLVPSAVAKGDVHGLFSYMFLHSGFLQLVGNMIVFWAFVGTLEAALGPWLTLLFYLFWGIVAGLLQSLAVWNADVCYIGATGAIAGVLGAYFYCFGLFARVKVLLYFGLGIPAKIVEVPASIFVSLWIFLQVWHWVEAAKIGVANVGMIAQLCGFAVGVVTMVIFKSEVQSKLNRTRDGKWEVKHEEPPPRSSARHKVVKAAPGTPETPAAETAELEAATTEVPNGKPPAPVARCTNCGAALADENRVVDELFRCPNCKMLSDPSLQALPKSHSRRR
jgi:membrane associated rhomboid family serine protease